MGGKTQAKLIEKEKKDSELKEKINQLTRLTIVKKQNSYTPPENDLKSFSSFFIRPIKDFVLKTRSSRREKHIVELVRFVFNKYTVPNFLYQAWTSKSALKIDFKLWYICVAQGGSLYKEYGKELFTKKEIHIFLNQKYDLTPDQAVIYAIAKAYGGNDGIALRIAKSRIIEQPFNEFWMNCVRFFSKDCPSSIAEINDLLDYLSYKWRQDNKFSLFGAKYTSVSLKKKMIDWHHELRRMKVMGNAEWEGTPLENEIITIVSRKEEIQWEFYQIKNTKELAMEGTAQRHCVFSYKDKCLKGHCSIWSVRKIDEFGAKKRALTIELNNNDSIVQVRGVANRMAKAEEKQAVQLWATKNMLYYGYYY